MAEPSLDFIGRQLQAIQTDLQQIKFAADVDRRNAASRYDNLVIAVGVRIGPFEATIEHRLAALQGDLTGFETSWSAVSTGSSNSFEPDWKC